MSEALFIESQQFRQPWMWGLLLLGLAAVSGGTFVAFQRQAAPTWSKALLSVATLLVLAVIALVYFAELKTVVRPDGLYVRFFPFHLSEVRIAPGELEAAEAVEYQPMRDYGGWGIRWSNAGKAYNVRGNRGVKLTFRDPGRKPLLIGSNQAEQLAAAVESLLQREE